METKVYYVRGDPWEIIDGELWKPIEGFSGYYISDHGRVLSHHCGHHLRKITKANNGYSVVSLKKGKRRVVKTIHRLVAKHFLENPNDFPIVMHLDNDKQNNYIGNLKWGTYQDNTIQAVEDGLLIPDVSGLMKNAKLTSIPVVAINVKTGEELYFESQSECSRTLNIRVSHISQIIRGMRKTSGGYSFRKAESNV